MRGTGNIACGCRYTLHGWALYDSTEAMIERNCGDESMCEALKEVGGSHSLCFLLHPSYSSIHHKPRCGRVAPVVVQRYVATPRRAMTPPRTPVAGVQVAALEHEP